MWLITQIGFFSIVRKPSDAKAGTLTIRARVRGDLDALRQHCLPGLGAIEETQDTDYRFRATAPRAQVSAAMARLVDDLDYGNFKSEVGKRQGAARLALYHDVWKVLHRLQTDPAFGEEPPPADSHGGVVVSGGNRVLLREPHAHHGGYAWTFAKTEGNPGETPEDAAVRAVMEKTGYRATIRARIPGLFEGSATVTDYFLMDAEHPPQRAGWQTARLRWATFDEARDLIGQTSNTEGRDRDLAVLEAAERTFATIPYREHARVQPEDLGRRHEMPARRAILNPRLVYTAGEMTLIRRGFFPTVMEEKWFVWFTGNRLRMHRSWTGFLIFDVGFSFDETGGASVTEVVVNRDPEQWGNTDEAEDLDAVRGIIRHRLLEPLEAPAADGLVEGLMLAAKPNYLGSPDVVAGLVGDLFEVAVQAVRQEASAEDLQSVTSRVIAAFTDDDAGYARMPGWHSAGQLGAWVIRYLVPPGIVGDGASLAAILQAGLGAVVTKIGEMLTAFIADPAATWEAHGLVQLNALHQYVVEVLLGTNTLSGGERTLGDFRWTPVQATGSDDT